MKDIQQLIKKNSQEGRYEDIFPKTFIDAVEDRESGNNLTEILSGFNMYFLSYNGSREQTRLQVPMSIRKTGLWITYVLYDKTVVTEWYAGEAVDDNSWNSSDNWRVGSNMLVGDISISSDGYWVVNGVVTTTKAQGEQGITPMLRVGSNNHLQVSYTNGSSWVDVSTNPVYTQFRVHDNKLEQSVDLGATWIVVSDELAYQFRNSGNKLQVSKDLGVTWEDTSDYIAAWFRFTGTSGSSQADNVGKIQISRDNGTTWSDLSGEFTNSLHIKGYVATVDALPSTAVQGDIYGVGPTYDSSDTEHTNPIYQLYVKDSTGWVNNGKFTSIAAGVVQTTGTSTTEVMSQDAVSKEFASIWSDLNEIEQEQIQGGVYDVSSHNDGAVFESLSTLLGSANLSTLIPTSVRRGGMSIRFIQGSVPNSDNKYVQYRLMADEFTTDTTQWAVADEGVYVENPEFVHVMTDDENKIYWAIKTDGSIYFGAGVPQQVIDYVEEKLADLSLDEYEDIAFLNDLEKGDKTLQTLLDEKVDKEEDKSLIPTQYIQEVENPEFVDVCTDNEEKLIEATTKEGVKVFFGGVDVKQDFTAKKISSNRIYLGEEELSPASTVNVTTIINDPEERLEIKTDEEQKIVSYRDEKGILHENVGIETKELKLSQVGLDLLSKDLKVNWSDYISNDGENPLHLSIPKCARINLLTDFDLTKLSKAGYSMYSKEGVNYDIPIELEFWDMQGNYFKKKVFIGGQGDSTMAFDKKNIAIDLFDSEWDGDVFSIKFGDWVAQDSFHLKAYDYEPFVGAGAWSYKLFEQMMSVYSPEVDHIWKRALWDTTANTPTQASGSDLGESSEYNDTGARCFPDGFPVIIYQNDVFWGVFAFQMKKHRDNYHLSGSNPNHVFLDGKIGEGTLDANGDPDAIRWDLWEVRNPKNIVYAPFALYNPGTPYKDGDSVTDFSRSRIYRSLQDNNTGNPLEFPYWKDCGDYTYKYDADITQAEIAGNHNGSSSYSSWSAGSYAIGDMREHNGHIFMNTVAGNTAEPIYHSKNNSDSSPDFKNKTGCGWLNITNTVKVKENIFAFTTIMTKIDAKETAYLANPTAENLAALKAEFETYFNVQNLLDYIVITDVIRDDDAFWKNWLWTTYDGIKWWCNLYDCNISFGYGGAGTGGFYRHPAPFVWNGVQRHLCTYESLQTGRSEFMLRYIIEYYKDELNQYWIALRNANVVEENNIYKIVKDWIDSVGLNAYGLENNKWGYVKHIDNMMRIYKWISQSVIGLDQLYGYFDNLYADFTIYRSTDRDYTIRCIDMKVSHVLSRQYSYIQGYITRHESVVDGETVSTYSITGGAETDEDITKTYTTVKEAIIAASSQPVDVPSSTLSYIMARCENIEYHRK